MGGAGFISRCWFGKGKDPRLLIVEIGYWKRVLIVEIEPNIDGGVVTSQENQGKKVIRDGFYRKHDMASMLGHTPRLRLGHDVPNAYRVHPRHVLFKAYEYPRHVRALGSNTRCMSMLGALKYTKLKA
ncbi:unnamed protein product [Dovyalis caffra]|uniref:Uncharacterized protein n=1 Tax=Dovyalis caffra TaxID=77055 RepID=A0AAV1RPM1_9ROSI|nr:unnamed protein product [Dovyalis caffra]